MSYKTFSSYVTNDYKKINDTTRIEQIEKEISNLFSEQSGGVQASQKVLSQQANRFSKETASVEQSCSKYPKGSERYQQCFFDSLYGKKNEAFEEKDEKKDEKIKKAESNLDKLKAIIGGQQAARTLHKELSKKTDEEE